MMQRFSQFIPSFSGNRNTNGTESGTSLLANRDPSFSVIEDVKGSFLDEDEQLLGLPRVMANARKKGTPVLG